MFLEIFSEESARFLGDDLPRLGLDQAPDEPDQVPVVRVPVHVRTGRFLKPDFAVMPQNA